LPGLIASVEADRHFTVIKKLFDSLMAISLGICLFQQENKRKNPNWINVNHFETHNSYYDEANLSKV